MSGAPIVVAGYFPPPVTGQAVATERLASLLESERAVERMDLNAGRGNGLTSAHPISVARGIRDTRRSLNKRDEAATVPWTSISPSPQGAWRDLVLTYNAWPRYSAVWGIVHWGNFQTGITSRLSRRALGATLSQLKGLVFLSHDLAESCRPHLPPHVNVRVIPNTVAASAIASDAELHTRRSEQRGKLRLLYLSNMIPSKGYLDALEGAAILHERDHLEIISFAGAWPSDADRYAFERRVAELGLANQVAQLGSIYDPDAKRRLFLESDAFLLPTYYPTEAQPLTILEAMATGTPIVTTRQGGIGEMLTDAEALFVAPRDPQAIADACLSLSNAEQWDTRSAAVRARFDATFSPQAVRAQWIALLDETVSSSSPSQSIA